MITFRRFHVDRILNDLRAEFKGHVLDVGGEKHNNRSLFIVPKESVSSWRIINIDPATGADIIAPAEKIPLESACADWVVMTELLEHVPDPYAVLVESSRLLKPGGKIFITMPFLYQVHGDPYDYQRWTQQKFNDAIEKTGFSVEKLEPMGGVFAVIYDLLRAHVYRSYKDGTLGFKVRVKTLVILAPLFMLLDKGSVRSRPYISTGWFVLARKE